MSGRLRRLVVGAAALALAAPVAAACGAGEDEAAGERTGPPAAGDGGEARARPEPDRGDGPAGGADPGAGGADPDAGEPPALHPEVDDWPSTTVEVVAGDASHGVAARVAATPERRRRGLQHVEEVPDGAGMLFVFDEDRDSGFWMKDTPVELDIAFATAGGRVVDVRTMAPCREDPCPTYRPDEEYRVALEVPGGWLADRGVGPGDRLVWE